MRAYAGEFYSVAVNVYDRLVVKGKRKRMYISAEREIERDCEVKKSNPESGMHLFRFVVAVPIYCV